MRGSIDQPPGSNDAWFESEESPGDAMIDELRRVRRRAAVRPLPVIVFAALLTSAIMVLLATRPPQVEAHVTLAFSEGSMATTHEGIPVTELRAYVEGVLLPDVQLRKLIERRHLFRASKRDDQFEIDRVRGRLQIEIWKNTFMYDDDDRQGGQSARIGLTVTDSDPDRAYDLAHDLAEIVIQTAQEHRQQMTTLLANEISALREGLQHRLRSLELERAQQVLALYNARVAHKEGLAQALNLEILELDRENKHATTQLETVAHSADEIVDRVSAAGLDMSVEIVEEHRPELPDHRGFVLALIAVVVGVVSLLGSAVLIGAFDGRVHDTDDVERLGLPVLGHVPPFPGDKVGSLDARGAASKRVASFLRWRFLR